MRRVKRVIQINTKQIRKTYACKNAIPNSNIITATTKIKGKILVRR